jgi:serine/threonine-protein kinase RsbT
MPQVVAGVSESIRRGQLPSAPRFFFSSRVRVRIPIGSEADIALAEQHGRQLATRLAFSRADITIIAAAIAEVAGNILQYAQRGDLMLHPIKRRDRIGIAIVARDQGPGIADIEQAIRDGKGLGLATTRRLMDEFRIRSASGRGTTVTMRKWTHRRQVERAGRRDAR